MYASYLDISGNYGISNRDNYVIIKDNLNDLIKIQKFSQIQRYTYLKQLISNEIFRKVCF